MEYYLSNFNQLLLSNIDFDYIVFDNFDSLYVQHNSADYMSKFDIGMNFGSVGGYWKDKILSHQSLADWVAQKMDKQISSINCKGATQGMFMSIGSAKMIFALLQEFLNICHQNNDMPTYLAEEVLFQVMLLTAEKE